MPPIWTTLALAASLAGQQTAAAEPEEDQEVCLAIARIWGGNSGDIARIRTTPVPESFRTQFTAGGCTRFQLVVSSLIDWHLAFGDEATTRAALTYLAADPSLAGAPAPDRIGAAVRHAWRQAEPDLRAFRAALTDGGGAPADETIWRNPRVGRLRVLTGFQATYLALAQQYLRAAQFYNSAAMLSEAERYVRAVREGSQVLDIPDDPQGFPGEYLRGRLDVRNRSRGGEFAQIDIGVALQRARLSRLPADIDAAQTLLDAQFEPVLRTAAENAERLDDFCDSRGDEMLSEIRAACRVEPNFRRRFVNFWLAQARADLLMEADPEHYVEPPRAPPSPTSASAYRRQSASPPSQEGLRRRGSFTAEITRSILRYADATDVRPFLMERFAYEPDFELYVAEAEALGRLADVAITQNDDHASETAADFLGSALFRLTSAATLVPVAQDPGRFRQTATRFLSWHPRYEALIRQQHRVGLEPNNAHGRQAAYFQAVLPNLERIATGSNR